jgi:hypothetical protein
VALSLRKKEEPVDEVERREKGEGIKGAYSTRARAQLETSSLTQVEGPVSCAGHVDECRMSAARSLHSTEIGP